MPIFAKKLIFFKKANEYAYTINIKYTVKNHKNDHSECFYNKNPRPQFVN